MEHLYDLNDKFKRVTNYKTNNSTMKYKIINLGSEKDPKNVDLGLGCTPTEWDAFIKLFKKYKDIFACTYDDLKTYDTIIIQYVILMESNAKPYHQQLRNMHPKLEPSVKKELNKLLDAKIVFLVRYSRWVSNLVPVRKKN